MCSSCVIASGIPGLGRRDLFDFRFRFLHLVHGIINPSVLSVGVAHNHLQVKVAGELLDCWDVGSRGRQIGDGGVPHRVRDDLLRV